MFQRKSNVFKAKYAGVRIHTCYKELVDIHVHLNKLLCMYVDLQRRLCFDFDFIVMDNCNDACE